MKHRFKKILAAVLSSSLCVPTLPTAAVQAAEANDAAIVWTDAETISATQISEEERVINFNEEWKFYLGDSTTAQNTDFIDVAWDDVNLPHDFSIFQDFTATGEAESGFLPGGTGWYRKKFTLQDSFSDKSIVLNFDGAYKDTYVYVNGTKVGEHHYGYTPFAFDISEYLSCDGITENVIAVKVVNQLPSSRWYSGSGIYRDVTLVVTNPVHVDINGTYVKTPKLAESSGSDGTINISADIKNDSAASANVTVKNTIYEKDSTTSVAAIETAAAVNAGQTKTVTAETKITDPKLWSIETPNMYTIRTEVLQDGSVIDTYETDFGFKWYEFVDNVGFQLNGEHVKINGVCMHHDQGALGSAAYYDAIYRQMEIMKNMGVNTIRVTHNPAAEILVDICNELGLLVIEEAFDGWGIPKNGNSNDFSVYFEENITADNQIIGGSAAMTWSEFALKSMIKRDRNDASIIMWSLCNEVQEGTNGNFDWAGTVTKLLRWVKEVDTEHLATSGSNNRNYGTSGVPAVNDSIFQDGGVVGYNYGDIGSMNSLHQHYPVMLWSETASAINSRGIYTSQASGGNADQKYHLTSFDTSRVSWGKTAHDSMYPTLSNDFIAGECVWTGFDYIGEPTPWNKTDPGDEGRGAIPNSSYFGIVETTGFPKDNYYLYRSQWNHDANTLHLVTAWDPDNKMEVDGKVPVWIYSNAAKVELYLNDQKIGTATRKALSGTTTPAGHVRYEYTTESNNNSICTIPPVSEDRPKSESLYSVFNVAFTAGTISAKAYDENNNEITNTCEGKTSVTTPGAANKLLINADKDSIDADGSSLSYITIDVTDANGNLKTKADNEINFSLTGEGEIVGVDNGDQATTKKYQQSSVLTDSKTAKINAYAGKALVIVRSTKNSGEFTINATSEGLTAASVTVQTEPVGDSIGATIKSYTLTRHCYLPIDSETSDVKLPETVKALLTDGTEKTLNIDWINYDPSILNTKGNYNVNGSITNENQTINIFIVLHVYDEIIGVQNHSLCTAPNTMPTLPTVCMSYDIDGNPFAEYPVEWDLADITENSFAEMNSIVTINGSVNIFGKEYETHASVRVAEPDVTYENVGTARDHLTDNAFENGSKTTNGVKSYDDNLLAVTDGSKKDSGDSSSRWSDWGHKSGSAQTNLQIAMDWATATTTDRIDIYTAKNGTLNGASAPSSVKFEYALTSNYDENDKMLKAEWIEIPHAEPTAITGINLGNITEGKSYKLNRLINPQAIRITFGHGAGSFISVNEIEIMHPTYTYDLNTDANLSGIAIGEQDITFNDTTNIYSLPENITTPIEIADITFENPNNAAVTILKRSDSLINIISVSEDGQNTQYYTITTSSDIPTEAEKTAFQTKLNEYKQIPRSDLKKNGYSLIQTKVQQCENTIDSMTKSDITKMETVLETLFNQFKKSDAMKSLEEKIKQIKSEYISKNYTPESYKNLQDLIKEIERKIDTLTDTQIAQESKKLDDAITALVPDEPQADTIKALQDKIAEYKALNSIFYTENSFKQFQTLLRKAEQQINNLSESQLTAKIEELNSAFEALEPNPDAPTEETKQNLLNQLDEYQELDSDLYIAANSYQALMTQINQIKNSIDSLSESQLQQKISDLTAAYNNLVRASLEETVTQYKTIESWHYTPDSYKELKDLLDAIDGNIDSMTDAQRKKNLTDLANAHSALVPDEPTAATKTKLTAKINEYKKLDPDNYTEASFKNLQDLIKEIESKLNTLSETELNTKYSELEQAFADLEESDNPPSDTKDQLLAKLEEYKQLDPSLYTEESYQALADLIEEIEQNIDTYTESQLQTKLTELNDARNDLEFLDPTAELKDKIKQYKSLKREDYTEESYQNLMGLIEEIESEMDSYSEEDVQTALEDLENAYNALEKVQGSEKPDKADLQAKLDEYKKLDQKLFTPASYAALQKLIKEIEAQIDELTEEEIEEKLAELEKCRENLVPDEPKTATVTALKNKLKTCSSTTYAPAAYNTIKTLVASINSTINTMSESQLQAKLKELNTATAGLLTNATLRKLQAKLNEFNSYKRADYTAASYNSVYNLVKQITTASKSYTKEQQANSKITELTNAYKKLQKVTPPKPTVKKGDSIIIANVKYEVIDPESCTVSATIASKKATKITIKDTVTINEVSCTVTEIPKSAFKKGAKKLKTIIIGKNIVKIGNNAFYGCKKLSKITFKNSNVKFGKKTFGKTNSKITVKVNGLKKSKRKTFKNKLIKAGISKKVTVK